MTTKIIITYILCPLCLLLFASYAHAGYSVKCWYKDREVSEVRGEFRFQSYADHPGPITGVVKCYQKSDKNRVAKEFQVKEDIVQSEKVDVIDESTGERFTGNYSYKPPAKVGIPVGDHRTVSKSNHPISEIHYDQNGKKQGLQKKWESTGSLKDELSGISWYENDQTQGSVSFVGKNADGKLKVSALLCAKRKLFPEHDRYCGFPAKTSVEIWRSWLSKTPDEVQVYEKGELLSSQDYVEGKLASSVEVKASGEQTEVEYFKNGRVKRRAPYKKDPQGRLVLHGMEEEFSEEGTRLRETSFELGEKQFENQWYENGENKEQIKRVKKDGSWMVQRSRFQDDGKLTSSGEFIEEKSDSNWHNYYFSNWTYEKPIGVHKYFEAGKLQSEETYSDGRKTEEKKFDTAGKLLEHFKVFKDGSRKSLLK